MRTIPLLLALVLFTGCQTPTPTPLPPPPVIVVPTLPAGEATDGILIHLRAVPTPQLRSLLVRAAVELGTHLWAIPSVELNNQDQQRAVEAALKSGATLTQYIP